MKFLLLFYPIFLAFFLCLSPPSSVAKVYPFLVDEKNIVFSYAFSSLSLFLFFFSFFFFLYLRKKNCSFTYCLLRSRCHAEISTLLFKSASVISIENLWSNFGLHEFLRTHVRWKFFAEPCGTKLTCGVEIFFFFLLFILSETFSVLLGWV